MELAIYFCYLYLSIFFVYESPDEFLNKFSLVFSLPPKYKILAIALKFSQKQIKFSGPV